DRGAVKADAVLEGIRQLGDRDRHTLQGAQDISEPEPDEPHVLIARGLQHIFPVGFVFHVLHHHAISRRAGQTKTEGAPAAGPSLRQWSSGSRRAEIIAEVYHTPPAPSTPGTESGLSSGKGGNKRTRGEQKSSLLHAATARPGRGTL